MKAPVSLIRYKCRHCGELDIIGTTWYQLNSWSRSTDANGEESYMVATAGGDSPLDTLWCNVCETEIGWDDVEGELIPFEQTDQGWRERNYPPNRNNQQAD